MTEKGQKKILNVAQKNCWTQGNWKQQINISSADCTN